MATGYRGGNKKERGLSVRVDREMGEWLNKQAARFGCPVGWIVRGGLDTLKKEVEDGVRVLEPVYWTPEPKSAKPAKTEGK